MSKPKRSKKELLKMIKKNLKQIKKAGTLQSETYGTCYSINAAYAGECLEWLKEMGL